MATLVHHRCEDFGGSTFAEATGRGQIPRDPKGQVRAAFMTSKSSNRCLFPEVEQLQLIQSGEHRTKRPRVGDFGSDRSSDLQGDAGSQLAVQ